MTAADGPFIIVDAAARIRRGELTPLSLLDICLARVARHEPAVKAWAYLDAAGAREQADRLTKELTGGLDRGPLHGIPVGIKDIIDVFDLPTGCGSARWANSYARQDAACVKALRAAGAVILGKTVTTAYASFDPPVTRNPWDTTRTPGGSSSGSAAAVACGMCLGALGTQTGGSLTRPAAYCGVYSLKPSHGRVSVDGVLPLAPSLDHVGVMANCVTDLAHLLAAITGVGPDVFSNTSSPAPPLLSILPGFPATAEAIMTGTFDTLRARSGHSWRARAGHSYRWGQRALPPTFADVPRNHHIVMAVEAAAYHASRLRRHPTDYGPKITELIRYGLSISAPEYVHVQHHHRQTQTDGEQLIGTGVNVLITPAATGPAPPADTTGNPAFNSPWSYLGLPTVSLPCGWTADGLPLGIQLIGRHGCEQNLLAVAALLEADIAFDRRPVPVSSPA